MTKKTLSISLYHIYRCVQQYGIYDCIDYLNTMESAVYMDYMIDAVYNLCTPTCDYMYVMEHYALDIADMICSYIRQDNTLINNNL